MGKYRNLLIYLIDRSGRPFLHQTMDAYISGGGSKEEAINYIHDVYGYVYTEKSKD